MTNYPKPVNNNKGCILVHVNVIRSIKYIFLLINRFHTALFNLTHSKSYYKNVCSNFRKWRQFTRQLNIVLAEWSIITFRCSRERVSGPTFSNALDLQKRSSEWPDRSPELKLLDFFLWVQLKSKSHTTKSTILLTEKS